MFTAGAAEDLVTVTGRGFGFPSTIAATSTLPSPAGLAPFARGERQRVSDVVLAVARGQRPRDAPDADRRVAAAGERERLVQFPICARRDGGEPAAAGAQLHLRRAVARTVAGGTGERKGSDENGESH